ncbi:flavodoxin domain-containing protein [Phototrophicus methaneseepsis]|uniref:Flavodoxin domain-containing protein n=1 Tax=Phototrophicus methaneseepsis TaxID=2710758 RepID=A0A7S8E515_9CHLR|nr:flavodoxin domain-containing protein [Phototrophicus methaneseepsis]QPC80508.1 flavodoxin domain-containing protein [Phototrophicus methaneseepsis]
MSGKILVTYASRTGSTIGVAEAVAQTLIDHKLEVDVLPMQDVASVAPYHAVVAGSAIQAGAWLPEAMQFLKTHQRQLNQKPFAAFLVCMTLALKNESMREQANVGNWLQPVRALVRPISEGLFAGILDISKVPSFSERMKFRVSVLSGVWSEGDHRDWDAIHTWADELSDLLQ